MAMYSQHNPGQLARIDEILTKYRGDATLANLLLQLQSK